MVLFDSDNDRWAALETRDSRADGVFVYSVKTTRIYCRPTCKARLARRSNVVFHNTPSDAEKDGFRACKRCRPELPSHQPHADVAKKACATIYDLAQEGREPTLSELAAAAGKTDSHFHRVFKSVVGMTPKAYSRGLQADADMTSGSSAASSDIRTPMDSWGEQDQLFDASRQIFDVGSEKERYFELLATSMSTSQPTIQIEFIIQRWAISYVLVAVCDNAVCLVETGESHRDLWRILQDRYPGADLKPIEWPRPVTESHHQLFESVMTALERPSGRMLNISPTALPYAESVIL